mmetsp:Transcript_27485/g.57547  ORF Transcript_27485/g.57547 Transcript_27485/m.57547 type:complete len:106 (+) Transcript_27485:345-662(+)
MLKNIASRCWKHKTYYGKMGCKNAKRDGRSLAKNRPNIPDPVKLSPTNSRDMISSKRPRPENHHGEKPTEEGQLPRQQGDTKEWPTTFFKKNKRDETSSSFQIHS